MGFVISQSEQEEIDRWLLKYPPHQKQSAVLPALKIVQEKNGGWLATEHLDAVADYLSLPKIAVYEVASFYSLFDLKPVGKHKIYVCTNVSCMLAGSETIVGYLERRLGIKMGETTQDGCFTLKEAECLAACGGAPAMQIDNTYYENLTPEKIESILAGLNG
ncbi:MAG: NADH-quinone oxidoreductase subunit NuoE [Gammaproteobacteria bacterium]|nr:NADH-quinone oxidoreductase subunit NuoE [Gammaproteobacteria bacterium]